MTINNVIEEISNSLSSESFLSIIDKKSNSLIECNSSLIPIFTKILSLSLNKPIIYINNSEDHCIDVLNWTKNLSTKTENIIFNNLALCEEKGEKTFYLNNFFDQERCPSG